MIFVLVLAVLLPVLLAAAFLLGRHLHRRQFSADQLSLVTRQHIDFFQGGQLSESLVEAAKSRFRALLERGEVAAVEASLRPGTHYAVHVRALAEIGTEDAGRILERQLHRRLSDDLLEQSWYWIDLAHGLRSLNRNESLPHLLRCAEAAGDIPLGHFFAAETVCFLGFRGYLRQLDTPLGTAALRVLHRALEGLRHGLQPQVVTEARLGEQVELLWDHRPGSAHPLLVRVFHETLRLLRRAPHARLLLSVEGGERETYQWQISRLAVLEPALADYLHEAPGQLARLLPGADDRQARDTLLALLDLRAETAPALLPLLERGGCPHPEVALETLLWSRDPRTGPWLRAAAARHRPGSRRGWWSRRAPRPPRPVAPLKGVLRALRGHPHTDTEKVLLRDAQNPDYTCRAAALGSLGWWEPVFTEATLAALQKARRDPHPEVRHAARAALARLGERHALQWFRQTLTSEDPHQVHDTIQAIAVEGLTLLWPDLDRLADAENLDVAHHAREALERLFEEMERNSTSP